MTRVFRSYARSAAIIALLLVMSLSMGCSSDVTSDSDDAVEQSPSAEQPTANDVDDAVVLGEEVLAGACSQCHDAARVFVQSYAVDWLAMVDEMVAAHGAALTDEEKVAVVEFLGSRELSEGEKVVAGKCGECHDASRIYEQGASADWAAIVQDMSEIHGATLTDDEKVAAVEFLNDL